MSFNHIGKYICECGREFTNAQSYNGHLSRCKVHLGEDRYNERNKKLFEANAEAGKRLSEKLQAKKVKKQVAELAQWVSEKHICEHCGKVMTEKFATGRFCSRACANSREQTDIMCWKKSATERGVDPTEWTFEKYLEYKNSKSLPKPKVEEKPEWVIIPEVEDEVSDRKAGWQSRSISYSYPEQFWKRVFDNNNVEFKHEEQIHNELTGIRSAVYKMDFLIDDKYDIEIDGGQHLEEDIKAKDERRDAYLTSLGYTVYRIPWVNPTSNERKEIVYKQIVDLFEFLGKELITKKD